MAELNPIEMKSFPTIDGLLSSDLILVFSESSSGGMSPDLYKVIDLSSVAALSDDIEEVKSKTDAVVGMIEDAKFYLSKTFASKKYMEDNFATKTEFNRQFDKLEKLSSFKERLNAKATIEYLEYQYNRILNHIASAKDLLGRGAGSNSGADSGWRGYKRLALSKAAKQEEEEG